MDFRGEIDNCEDTLLILESAYNIIPNKPLLAGEKLISAIQIESIDYKILAYPNPAHDQIHITLEGTESAQFQFSVMDAFGATIHVHKRFVHQQTLDISEWDTGIYYLKIQDAISKRTKFYKFVKI